MKTSDYLKAISVMLDSTIKDAEEYERNGSRAYFSDRTKRAGASKIGIQNSIAIIRRMLMQVSKEVSE